MVFIKTVASIKKEEELVEAREQLASKMEQLRLVATEMDDLTRLKTIIRNVDKLCAGKRAGSERELERRRERNKIMYDKNKDKILASQRDARKKRRLLKEEFEAKVNEVVGSKVNKHV